MHKSLTHLLFLFALAFCFVLTSDVFSQSKSKNEDIGVESVALEKEKIFFCPWSRKTEGECSKKGAVEVSVNSPIAEKEGFDYYYSVSVGEIIGKGSKVIWDLSKAKTGKYSITVWVGKDSIVKGKIMTKSVSLEYCDCMVPCSCPGISIFGPTAVAKRGDKVIFTAEVKGDDQSRNDYYWTVSDGEIIVGQGTKQILVLTSPNMKANIVTATFEVRGICPDCEREISASAEFENK